MARAQPMAISQPTWLAAVNAARNAWLGCPPAEAERAWRVALATAEPMTATPRTLPSWRELVAMAEATPAWARGMPETAALVMGGPVRPSPVPRSR